jgi:hypothetical protein
MRNTIVVLDDDERRQQAMRACLVWDFASYGHRFFDNAPDIIAWLRDHLQEAVLISLDHDLGPNRERDGRVFDPGTGRDVADFLATQPPQCPVILATTNSLARPGMELVLQDAGWTCVNVIPFGDLEWIENVWRGALA